MELDVYNRNALAFCVATGDDAGKVVGHAAKDPALVT